MLGRETAAAGTAANAGAGIIEGMERDGATEREVKGENTETEGVTREGTTTDGDGRVLVGSTARVWAKD
jgi:hypothetical protein